MPQCQICNKTQARFKDDGSLCTKCFNDHNAGQVKSRNNDTPLQQNNDNSLDNDDSLMDNATIDMEKKVADLTIGELLKLFQLIIKPLEEGINAVNVNLSKKIVSIEKRADILEKEDSIKTERISQLTNTVMNMQQALNSIDKQHRAKNIIITGMTEEDITIDGGLLAGDVDKIKYIYRKIGISEDIINQQYTFERIGKETGEKLRALKIILKDYTTRETIIKNAPRLKDLGVPLNKVYINRDTHPVYRKEYQRLRKKFNDLKNRPDLPDGSVKLVKGELIVNDTIVDRNMFLN